jgi:hypothetical protein
MKLVRRLLYKVARVLLYVLAALAGVYLLAVVLYAIVSGVTGSLSLSTRTLSRRARASPMVTVAIQSVCEWRR